jgi:predicted lipoprotein
MRADPAGAKKKYSHGGGLGSEYFYFISGEGRVVATNDDGIALSVSGPSTNADVVLQTGLIFGDAIRDGTGLLDVNEFPNSQEFNDISTALNHIVETQALPATRQQAHPGGKIRFTGCAQVEDDGSELLPLKVVPIACRLEAD